MNKASLKMNLKTNIAFVLLFSPFNFFIWIIIFGLLASFLEQPCNREGVYVFFASVTVIMILVLPIGTIPIAFGSIVMQIIAIRSGESKIKNFSMMIVSLVLIVVGFVMLNRMFEGLKYI